MILKVVGSNPTTHPFFFLNSWVIKKNLLKKNLLKKHVVELALEKYSLTEEIGSFFLYSFKLSRRLKFKKLIRYFRVYNYYNYISYSTSMLFTPRLLHIIWNLKRHQLFVNFLNAFQETIHTISTGVALNILKQHGKSHRRKFKGFFLVFNYIKKKATRLLKNGCLLFIFKKWKKVNNYFLENFFKFFQSLKKTPSIFILVKPAFAYNKVKLKKYRSIKRRLTKKLVITEKTFFVKKKEDTV